MNFRHLLENTAFGLFLGTVVASAVAITLDADIASEWKKWSTYGSTALVSLISATLAVFGVLTSLDNQTRLRDEERERKAQSARAFLANSLSQVCDIAREGIRSNYAFSDNGIIESATVSTGVSKLALSEEIVTVFRDLIENSTDIMLRNRIAELLRVHQVLVARTKGTAFQQNDQISDLDYAHVTHWAYFYAVASSLFDYARGKTDTVKSPDYDMSIKSELHELGVRLNSQSLGQYQQHIEEYEQVFSDKFK